MTGAEGAASAGGPVPGERSGERLEASELRRVRGVALGITGTATELGGASHHQQEVAQGLGASSAQIAAAVRQITATGAELLRGMEQLSQAASDTARLAGEGREGLMAMGSTMEGLNAATAGVAERLAAINEKAGSINAIVDTIVKVADQTNLLSVNAAIEAEKAGESGRGFLVVAREIRRLADQTASATLDIETTVRQMQGAVSGGVMEMDRFSEQVRRGVQNVREVGERLTEVIDRVGSVEGRFGEVTEGMQSQVQGADQIRQSMDALAQNAARAREATGEFAQQRFVDRRSGEGEVGEFLGQRQARGGELVLDRARLLFGDLGLEQLAENVLDAVLALEAARQHFVVGRAHAGELEPAHHLEEILALHQPALRSAS